MNDRIKELAEQVYGTQATEQEIKFAQLIVQECAHLVDTLNEAYDAPSTAGKFIKEHFELKNE